MDKDSNESAVVGVSKDNPYLNMPEVSERKKMEIGAGVMVFIPSALVAIAYFMVGKDIAGSAALFIVFSMLTAIIITIINFNNRALEKRRLEDAVIQKIANTDSNELSVGDLLKYQIHQDVSKKRSKSIGNWFVFAGAVLFLILFWPIGIILLLVWLFRVLR